jgi:hypothetical protein
MVRHSALGLVQAFSAAHQEAAEEPLSGFRVNVTFHYDLYAAGPCYWDRGVVDVVDAVSVEKVVLC